MTNEGYNNRQELLAWLPRLERGQDVLSQRVITHAVYEGWDLLMLAFMLEIDQEELEERWRTGVGFWGVSDDTRAALAEIVEAPLWHIPFLTGELSVLDLVTQTQADALEAQAKVRWPDLLAVNDTATALFALLLSGEDLMPPAYWAAFDDAP